MKKKYEAPIAEAVKFEYKDQVVAASGCDVSSGHTCPSNSETCSDWTPTGKTN